MIRDYALLLLRLYKAPFHLVKEKIGEREETCKETHVSTRKA